MEKVTSGPVFDGLEVVEVEWLDGEDDVYDITVAEDASFIVHGAVVHNCNVCAALDLKEFPMDKGPRPPQHVNCRCTTTAVLIEKFAALNVRSVRPSVGPDGAEPQSAGVSYFAWLKQQPEPFVVEAIGAKRAKLLLSGGLSSDRFAQLQLDKNFEPITLAEAKLLEPLAFKDAGL